MKKQGYYRIRLFFSGICWFTAVSFAAYCLYIFNKNEDLCTVHFMKYYASNEDVFPSLSLCFKNPFIGNNLSTKNDVVNETLFLQFLKGRYYIPTFASIGYQDVKMNISEHFDEYWIKFRDGYSSYEHEYFANGSNAMFDTSYVGFWSGNFYQCSSMQVPPDKSIQAFFVLMNTTVFRYNQISGDYRFITFLHYPNQLLRSSQFVKMDWPDRKTNDTFVMRFKINAVEVLRRRNKGKDPCDEDWTHFDDNLLERHIKTVGCKAPYQRQDTEIKPCTSEDEMKKSVFQIRADDYGHAPPCKSMEKILYTYEQHTFGEDSEWKGVGQVWIGVYFGQDFKEIKEVR